MCWYASCCVGYRTHLGFSTAFQGSVITRSCVLLWAKKDNHRGFISLLCFCFLWKPISFLREGTMSHSFLQPHCLAVSGPWWPPSQHFWTDLYVGGGKLNAGAEVVTNSRITGYTIVKMRKQLKCPPTEKWIKKMWCDVCVCVCVWVCVCVYRNITQPLKRMK